MQLETKLIKHDVAKGLLNFPDLRKYRSIRFPVNYFTVGAFVQNIVRTESDGTSTPWSRAAVPNLWVAAPRGVAIDFHWGRHWSSDILKIHAQLHIYNVRSCLCQKLCSVKYFPSITGFNKINASSTLALVEN